MSLRAHEGGVALDAEAAEGRASVICARLDHAAVNFEAAMDLMRAAITDRDDIALGYRSPGDYLSDRFGGKLARLGVDLRREVVRELTEAGLSTRAIAPVVGTNFATVSRDRARVADATPETPAPSGAGPALASAGSTPKAAPDEENDGAAARVETDDSTAATPEGETPAPPRPPVVGIDGKTYAARPEEKPAETPKSRPRRPLTTQFDDAAFALGKAAERVARLTDDDRFTQNAQKVAARNRSDLLRARDVLDDVIARMP